MADLPQQNFPKSPTTPIPPPAPPTIPPRPISPPAGIPVKETDMSNLTPSPTPFKASIRTMESDVKKAAPAPVAPPPPRPTDLRPSQSFSSKPISLSSPSASVPPPIKVPPPSTPSSGSHRFVWALVILILAGAGVAAWLLTRGSSEPKTTPTPKATESATPEPTPIPKGFIDIFPTANTSMETAVPAVGEIQTFLLTSSPLHLPSTVAGSVDITSAYTMLFGKPDGTKGTGFAWKVSDAASLQSALTTWQPTMSNDIKTAFNLNTKRAASTGFLTATYQGVDVQYRNFPDAFNTIDYAIVKFPNDDQYLVLTNTRDHMLSIIDRIVGIVLGK